MNTKPNLEGKSKGVAGSTGMKRMTAPVNLLLLFVLFLVFTIMNNQFFQSVRIDLTQNNLYTLTEGTKDLIDEIDEPIKFRFFFSQQTSEDLTALRAYARRVAELLEEYQAHSEGLIALEIIDPEPFSDEEDLAAQYGLQSVPVNGAGDELYFGLVGTNAVDDQQIISFFQPDKEEFLEYDISRIVQQLSLSQKPRVGLLSSLKVRGDIDMSTFQTTPAWVVIDQLVAQYEVVDVSPNVDRLPPDLQLLIIIHPKLLSDAILFAIDQFAMSGGRVLLFVDPLAEMDQPASGAIPPPIPSEPVSDFPLLSNWGVQLREGVVLADAQSALNVGGADGQPVRHLGILGLTIENFDFEDVTLNNLESINTTTIGILDKVDGVESKVDALIRSSANAMPMSVAAFQSLDDPEQLFKQFVSTGERYVLAARLSGHAMSAFPDGLGSKRTGSKRAGSKETGSENTGSKSTDAENEEEATSSVILTETDQLNVIVVADSDLLTDRLWVQVQDFFGQTIATPWANNGDFVLNSVDNLVGGSELISIRSRGRFTRPFTVVDSLRQAAQSRYQESADTLQRELEETETQLSDLETSQGNQNILSLSPEQEIAVIRFQDEKLRIRKQLRDVRHQLDSDINGLGSILKFLNIALLPIMLVLLVFGWRYVRSLNHAR